MLATAHTEQTRQLYDARGALSAAVAALSYELSRLHEQLDLAHVDLRKGLEREEALRNRVVELEADLATMRDLKIVRWSKWPRSLVYRLRARTR